MCFPIPRYSHVFRRKASLSASSMFWVSSLIFPVSVFVFCLRWIVFWVSVVLVWIVLSLHSMSFLRFRVIV